ncbi:hypothetical protein KI387_020729, partial [Taxus chinensis]
ATKWDIILFYSCGSGIGGDEREIWTVSGSAGSHCAPWFFGSQVRGNIPLRVQKLDVRCETKTKDNVFVTMVASVQYRALVEKASDAFYKYFDTMKEIGAHSKSSSVFIPHGPRTVHDVAQQIRDGLLQGSHAQQLLKRAHIFL